ncbi:MAG: glycosyltransferase family 2 protein [Planctomycetota bacterium]
MLIQALVYAALALAALPLGLAAWNLALYRPPAPRNSQPKQEPLPGVSVLIPARDEEGGIGAAIDSAIAAAEGYAGGGDAEFIVLDDHSTDRTADIVRQKADQDPRVRLETAPPLPEGWCGKQHACWQLSRLAKNDILVWIDADVRLEPGALSAVVHELQRSKAGLISGVPRQETGTLAERLVVHLIPLVLLGYLPMAGMRRSKSPGFGAGCGQLFVAKRSAYEASGGHAHPIVRPSMHDGVTLPRAFRLEGQTTDLFDATPVARCRMYRGLHETWQGFAKNATEGMATPGAIGVWTVLLLGGHVLPFVLTALWLLGLDALAPYGQWILKAFAMSGLLSVLLAWRFRQGWQAALLRPGGVILLVGIQWYALLRKLRGHRPAWRGRDYAAG